ncbi:hypothetical protein [Idiomarina abyssalis]|uniref:hypothetical protein n=1 Tax=Idiomarina abyssalis TaxID=86102 RepID=UPI001C970BF5|nr:hypothetical protein [Idiomarina abyssalis]QZN91646.1 hypothetical protein K5X84_03810 [Idiomarina abyssalis]
MTTIIQLSKWIGIPMFLIYLTAMVVIPAFSNDWDHVQNVWERWQGLNVGVLAFMTSLVALNISRYNAEKQRIREFRAAQANLPSALDELCHYTDTMSEHYKKAWDAITSGGCFNVTLPELSTSFKPVFSECIRHARPEVGDWLAAILTKLQIQRARSISSHDNPLSSKISSLNNHAILDHMYSIGELRALINRMFPFARGEENFNDEPLKLTEFYSAYHNVGIAPERFRYTPSADDEEYDLQIMTCERIED